MPLSKTVTKTLEKIQGTLTTDESLSVAKQVKKWTPSEVSELGYPTKRIAFFPGYSTQFLASLFRVNMLKHKYWSDVLELPFTGWENTVFSKDSSLETFSPEICYFCVGSEHFQNTDPEAEAERWLNLAEQIHAWLKCSVIINTFEEPLLRSLGNYDFKSPTSELTFVKKVNEHLRQKAPSWLHFFDVNSLANYHGKRHWKDEKYYDLYKLPCAFTFLAAYAAGLAGVASSLYGSAKKCIVLDLDDTLWGGIVGDAGVEGIEIGNDTPRGEGFMRFQKYLKSLKELGILLAVCSKNDEKNVREAFEKRKEMVLKLEDFSAFIANWDPKPDNIAKIAKDLNLGLESLVFIDDNPAERALVRTTLPHVTCLELGDEPAFFARHLSEAGLFETVSLTEEDKNRSQLYKAEIRRKESHSKVTDYPSYLKSLQMTAEIRTFDTAHLPRISQLINKTNQFNLTLRRYTESETALFVKAPDAITRYIKLSDQFGDHGLISAFVGRIESDELFIDTWVMSCRVFKREVEVLMLKEILEEATKRGIKNVRAHYRNNHKNEWMVDLLKEFGFTKTASRSDGSSEWELSLKGVELQQEWLKKELPIKTLQ